MERTVLSQRLAGRLPLIVFLLCLLQPCMDVLSFWLERAGISNAITLALRLGILFFMVFLGFLLTDRRKYYYMTAALLLAFTLCHVAACISAGYVSPLEDLTNLVRIYQLPLTALAFITYLRREPRCLEAMKRGFFWCLMVILAVELLSIATGTNPYTYPNKALGILGWFYFANAQSAILSMLVPVAIVFVLEKKDFHPLFALAICLAGFGVLYFFATRLSYAALLGTGIALTLSLLILRKTKGYPACRAAFVLLLCTVLAAGCYRLSPMYRNTQMVADNLALKQEDIDTMVASDTAAAAEAGMTEEERQLASLRSAYEKYLPGPTQRFGLARTAELYRYSTDAGVIADVRLERLNFCRMLLEDSPRSAVFFGMELGRMSQDGVTYDVENDFHGIFYLCGGVGLGLMLVFLLWFLLRIGVVLFRNFREYFTLEAVGFGIALICCLAHAYFTAGVLRRPNTTFYMALILAAVYHLTRRNPESLDKKQ